MKKTILYSMLLVVALSSYAQSYMFNKEIRGGALKLNAPNALALDADGNLYVSDKSFHTIQKLDTATGEVLARWGSYGSTEGQFKLITGIAINSEGDVYVVDQSNNRIQKFSNTGEFILTWGSSGSGNGTFTMPCGIALDANDNLFVTDYHRVQKFDKTGNFLTSWGGYGSETGQLAVPTAIVVDGDGNVIVSDSYNYRIQKFSNTGTFLTAWGNQGTGDNEFQKVNALAIDGEGNVLATDQYEVVKKFSNTGTFIASFSEYGTEDGQLNSPEGLAADANGNFFVSDMSNRIQKFNSAGTFVKTYTTSEDIFGGYSQNLAGLALDDFGKLYMSDLSSPNIKVFDRFTGAYLSSFGSFNSPSGIAIGNADTIYIINTGMSRIDIYNSAGNFLSSWGQYGSGDGRFNGPRGIAVDSDGNVYVADQDNNNIQKFTSKGIFIARWGGFGTDDGQFANPLSVATDGANNVYVVDFSNHRIQKFDSYGNFTTKWGILGSADGEFHYPSGVAVDSNGTVFVTDRNNKRVQMFDATGTFIAKWDVYPNIIGNGVYSNPVHIAVSKEGRVYIADLPFYGSSLQEYLPLISAESSLVVCEGNSVVLTSASAFNNQWYLNGDAIDGATTQTYEASETGMYSVVVSGNSSLNLEVIVNPTPSVPTITPEGTTEFCEGGSVVLTSSEMANVWYLNGNVIEGFNGVMYEATESGSYTANTINGACSSALSSEIDVTVNENPVVSITAVDPVCLGSANVSLTASPAGGSFSGTTVSGASFTPSTAGTNTVLYAYTDANGCSGETDLEITVNVCTGVNENTRVSDVKCFPNPGVGFVTIEFNQNSEAALAVSVKDLSGTVLAEDAYNAFNGSYSHSFDLSTFPKGVYMLEVRSGANASYYKIITQ